MRTLDELFAYEGRSGLNPELRANQFIKNTNWFVGHKDKNWYVKENSIGKIIDYPVLSRNSRKYRIHGLSSTASLGLLMNFAMSRKELLPSTADVILNKHEAARLRAFYNINHSHRCSLKIALGVRPWKKGHVRMPGSDLMEALKREVTVREQLASLKTINIPKVLSADVQGDAFFLLEEMILGRRFNARVDGTLYRMKVLPQLRDTYLAYGVRYAPIQDFLPPELSGTVTRFLGERADGKSFVEALNNVIERNGLAAVSLCHGALSTRHLAVTNGEVYFLDWKRADEGLIILDLIKTPLRYPTLTYMIGDIREIMMPNLIGKSYRFEDMLTLGIAHEFLRNLHPRRVSNLLRVWQHHALSRPG